MKWSLKVGQVVGIGIFLTGIRAVLLTASPPPSVQDSDDRQASAVRWSR